MLLRGRLRLFGAGRQVEDAAGWEQRGGRIRADCLPSAGAAQEGRPAAAVPGLVFSVVSIDGLVFMELLNHRFEKGTAHRGYKLHAGKRGW